MQDDEHVISTSNLLAMIGFFKETAEKSKISYELVLETYKVMVEDKRNLILVALRNDVVCAGNDIAAAGTEISAAVNLLTCNQRE